jgi:hypothetical protein
VGAHQLASIAEIPRAIWYPTGPDYVGTMQIPLLRGRSLTRLSLFFVGHVSPDRWGR